jgi:hypothetical protein
MFERVSASIQRFANLSPENLSVLLDRLKHLMIVITHSVAILSLPFGWIGFWGLTLKLGTDKFGSVLAFAMISLGLIAVLLAGATNGLVFPIFMQHYKDASPETMTAIDPGRARSSGRP